MFVSKEQLESLFELGFTYAKVAKMLCMSERTLQRRRSELGLPIGQSLLYSQLSDEELKLYYRYEARSLYYGDD